MTLSKVQNWVNDFNNLQEWTPEKISAFEMMNYLTEETGELARAIRTIEVGRNRPDEPERDEQAVEHLVEEIGDVIGALTGIANHYHIALEEAFANYQNKMMSRYGGKNK